MLKINIVCDDIGWIYSRFIEKMKKHSKHQIFLNSKSKCDVTHYLPYYHIRKPKHVIHPSTGWFSHQESEKHLKNLFVSSAKVVDMAISHSLKYARLLRDNNIRHVMQIMPGVDLEKFTLRSESRPTDVDKLVVGYVGRQYTSSSRKNPVLLGKISKLPFVEFRATDGKLSLSEIPDFYRDLDVAVSTSIIEGGSMTVTESLACGLPIICFDDVGVAREFDTGVIKVKFNDSQAFLNKIKYFWDNKKHLIYRNPNTMQKMRDQIKDFTWENFVKKHDEVWESLV